MTHILTGFQRCLPVALVLAGCQPGQVSGPPEDLTPDPGVVFTYPYNGQADVALDAAVLASFTDPVNPQAIAEPCFIDRGAVTGGFCVVGPEGTVAAQPYVAGPNDNVVVFPTSRLTPNTDYEVYVAQSVLWDLGVNLPTDGPLLRFRTAATHTRPDQAPALIALNGVAPEQYIDGATTAPEFPFADFTTLRLVFDEPIDSRTLNALSLVRVGDDGQATPVAAGVFGQGARVVIDPDTDLEDGVRYELRIGDNLRDLDGQTATPGTFVFFPEYSGADGQPVTQGMRTSGAGALSRVSGAEANAVGLSSPLIGDHVLTLRDSFLQIELANPARFGTRVPVVVRKGQSLNVEGLGVSLAGQISTDLETDDLAVQIITDGTGYLTRNPFRAEERLPDDDLSPVFAYLTFDVAVQARNELGNAVLNQTILNVQATGLARVLDGGLTIEMAASMELDLLGLTQAPSTMSLRFSTTSGESPPVDNTVPTLSASYPENDSRDFPVDDSVLLTFSESIDLRRLQQAGGVTLVGNGQPIAARVEVLGSTVVVDPTEPLPYGADYEVQWDGRVFDLAGNPAGNSAAVRFRTPDPGLGLATPMLLSAVYPGIPCALRDGNGTSPGRCVDGGGDDDRHAVLALPANRPIEAHFNQPLSRASVTLGSSCGTGSVRIERLDAAGGCVEAVAGKLEVTDRGLRFAPDVPWADGQRYRLTLRAGDNDRCDGGELCGLNGLPLNTDGLDGMIDDGDGGGPDAVYELVATASTDDTYAITSTRPVADVNGNGAIDGDETPGSGNRAALSITGTSGLIQSATINGPDCAPDIEGQQGCMHLSASLPVSLESVQDDCLIDGRNVGSCIPVRVFPQVLYGTSLSIDAQAAILGTLRDIRTEQIMIRLRERDEAPIYAHIYQAEDGSGARIHVPLSLYLDAPDMRLIGGLAGHDLRSKAVDVVLEGAVTFAPDGRLLIDLANVAPVAVPVGVSALGLGVGGMDLSIPTGGMTVQLLGSPLKGGSARILP